MIAAIYPKDEIEVLGWRRFKRKEEGEKWAAAMLAKHSKSYFPLESEILTEAEAALVRTREKTVQFPAGVDGDSSYFKKERLYE